MILIALLFCGVVVPPASESVTVETPLTTVMESVVVVDVSKFDESVGVKVAVRETEPRAFGVHEQVAVVDAADAEPQPEMVVPPRDLLKQDTQLVQEFANEFYEEFFTVVEIPVIESR